MRVAPLRPGRWIRTLAAVAAAWLVQASALAPPASAGGFVPVFWEDFDGTGPVDASRWAFETGFVRNEELQLYTNSTRNARRVNGKLVLEAHRQAVNNPAYDAAGDPDNWKTARKTAAFTSASIYSKEAWAYGRYDVRAKVPAGNGMFPAIWLLGNNEGSVGWPACGEIDIMENVGYEPRRIHGTVHKAANPAKEGGWLDRALSQEPWSSGYHIYSIDWAADRIAFMVDYDVYYTYERNGRGPEHWPYDHPFKMLLNVAVGGNWGGNRGITASFPQRMTVDWVRVYKWVD